MLILLIIPTKFHTHCVIKNAYLNILFNFMYTCELFFRMPILELKSMSLKVMIPMLHAAIQTQTMPGLMKVEILFPQKTLLEGANG